MIEIKWVILIYTTQMRRKWESAVDTATSYWSDGPGFESRHGQQVSCAPEPFSPALGPNKTPI